MAGQARMPAPRHREVTTGYRRARIVANATCEKGNGKRSPGRSLAGDHSIRAELPRSVDAFDGGSNNF